MGPPKIILKYLLHNYVGLTLPYLSPLLLKRINNFFLFSTSATKPNSDPEETVHASTQSSCRDKPMTFSQTLKKNLVQSFLHICIIRCIVTRNDKILGLFDT